MLEIDFDAFKWSRPVSRRKRVRANGYTWEQVGEYMRLAPVPGASFKDYKPDSALFRTFAELDETPEAILKFANRYGALKDRLALVPLSFWKEQITLMRQAVRLQDALESGDLDRVRLYLNPPLGFGDWPGMGEIKDKLSAHKKLSDHEAVNAAVCQLAYPAIGAFGSLLHKPEVIPEKRIVRLKPPDLLTFMWLQFGHALIGRREFRQCKTCSRWFQIDPHVNRPDRATCSDSCRFRQYRQRRQHALELHRQGRTAKQIAKELSADVNKVKTWISKEQAQ